MKGYELSVYITALAIAIGAQIEDAEELALVGTLLTQLADTVTTIAAQRAWEENKKKAEKEKQETEEDKG